MKTRDEYVARLKTDLDRWNAEAAEWEKHASATKAKQLEAFHARREEAMYQLRLVESASAAAWNEFTKGADEAWDRMKDALKNARFQFEKSPSSRPGPKG